MRRVARRRGACCSSYCVSTASPVAAELTFLYGGTCYAYNGCHDPGWRGEHVGTILQWEVIRHAILAGCREYDFLRGTEEYKTHWGSEPRRHARIRLIRASRKLRMVRAATHLVRTRPGARLTKWARRLWSPDGD